VSEVHTRLLRAERDELFPLLERTSIPDFSRTTVCEGWSVRDVLAHCAEILIRVATRVDPYGFTPEENQMAVEERRAWPIADVLAELARGYSLAERSPAVAKVALAEWIHGGDIRDALGVPDAYASAGLPEALTLLVERSIARGTPPVDVTLVDATERGLDSAQICLGDPNAEPVGWLRTDAPGLFRIVADRRANLVERDIVGISLNTLRLFH
jgi:uncharacterized protein (TIGR03083 family)